MGLMRPLPVMPVTSFDAAPAARQPAVMKPLPIIHPMSISRSTTAFEPATDDHQRRRESLADALLKRTTA